MLAYNVWPGVAILVGGRAHRALEDTLALRAVVHHCADTLGLTPDALLCPFVCSFDVNATLVARIFM